MRRLKTAKPELINPGKQKGYELVSPLNYNAFIDLKQDFPLFDIADNDIDSMRSCINYGTIIFRGSDGTVFHVGSDELLWKGIRINQEEIQVLPKAMSRYFEPLDGQPGGYTPVWIPEVVGKP